MKRNIRPARVILPLLIAVVALALAMPRHSTFSYEYRTGEEWKYDDFFSDINFPVLKTEEQMREAATVNSVIPYYRFSGDVTNGTLRAVSAMDLGHCRQSVLESLRAILEKGILPDVGVKAEEDGSIPDVIYVQKDKHADKRPAADVWLLADARAKILSDALSAFPGENPDSLFRAVGLYDSIVPNLSFDSQATALVNARAEVPEVSPTSGYVSNGELIVRKGEIVTSEIAQMLDSYRSELESHSARGSAFVMWVGNVLLTILIAALLFLSIWFTNPDVFLDNRYPYAITVFLITALGTLLAIKVGGKFYLCIPYTLCVLFLQAFFRARVIIPVYSVSLLPLLLFANHGTELYVMFLLAGLVSTYAFGHLGKGWKQFVVALINFAVLCIGYAAFALLGFMDGTQWTGMLSRLFVGSLLTVAGYPLIYLFEKIFNLVSNSRLRELCDTSNSMIRDLEQVAPGTFQHSLQVMNMADAVARAVDANPLLVRAGALYHDIGKIRNPQCFVENESLVKKNEEDKYHSPLTPEQSAQDIIRHMTDGVEMARKNHLPDVIVDFIRTHHGTTLVSYFYNKAMGSGHGVDESDFRYPGQKPRTKEQIILMLCDSIEAASRSLSDYSPESCSAFVERMVKGKMDEGQFDDSDISIRELGLVKEVIKTYLAQMHHGRVVYPENRKHKR